MSSLQQFLFLVGHSSSRASSSIAFRHLAELQMLCFSHSRILIYIGKGVKGVRVEACLFLHATLCRELYAAPHAVNQPKIPTAYRNEMQESIVTLGKSCARPSDYRDADM